MKQTGSRNRPTLIQSMDFWQRCQSKIQQGEESPNSKWYRTTRQPYRSEQALTLGLCTKINSTQTTDPKTRVETIDNKGVYLLSRGDKDFQTGHKRKNTNKLSFFKIKKLWLIKTQCKKKKSEQTRGRLGGSVGCV